MKLFYPLFLASVTAFRPTSFLRHQRAPRFSSSLASTETEYDYDYVVIGGGSGGVRSSRIAAGYGAKVALLEGQLEHGAPGYSAGALVSSIVHSMFGDDLKIDIAIDAGLERKKMHDNGCRKVFRLR